MTAVPPPAPSPDDRRQAFLARAAPILARERGLSARARLLLDSLARDMKLAEPEFQELLAQLQRPTGNESATTSPELAAFRDLLRVQFATSTTKILSAAQEQKLWQIGVSDLKLPGDVARDEIRSQSLAAGCKRVSREEAARYMEEVVEQKTAGAETIDPAVYTRLFSLGHDWGLEPAAVEELIRNRLENNYRQRRREQFYSRWGIVGGIAICGLAMISLIAFVFFASTASRDAEEPVDNTANSTAAPNSPDSVPRTRLPTWWTAEIAVAASNARRQETSFQPAYDAFTATDATRRGQGYELLTECFLKDEVTTPVRQSLATLIADFYRLEPDEEAANRLCEASFLALADAARAPPARASHYGPTLALISLWCDLLADDALAEARRDAITAALERLLQQGVPDSAVQRTAIVRSRLAVLLLGALGSAVEKHPEVLTEHYPYLASLAREHAAEQLPERQAQLVAEALRHEAKSYHLWKNLAIEAIEVRNNLSLLKLIDAWEACRVDAVREDLAPRLLARAGLAPAGISPDQLASRLRMAFGVDPAAAPQVSPVWTTWNSRLDVLLARRGKPPEQPIAQLRDVVECAWHVNVTMILQREGISSPRLLAALEQGSPADLASPPATAKPSDPAGKANEEKLSPGDQQTLERYVTELAEPEAIVEGKRASNVRGLAKFSESWPDISPRQAQMLAKYLVFPVQAEEANQLLEAVVRLRRWRQVRLALADELLAQPARVPALIPLVTRLAGREPDSTSPTSADLHQLLVQSVLQEVSLVSGPDAGANSIAELDRLGLLLAGEYRERAQRLGISPAELTTGGAPSLLLRSVEQLRSPGKPATEFDYLLALARQPGLSSLQRTVLIQRAFIEESALLAKSRVAGTKSSGEQNDIATILENQVALETSAKTALLQLRAGEFALLELWRIGQPSR